MKNLYNFILEDADNSSKKFDNVAKTLDELKGKKDDLYIFSESVPDEVRNAFQAIANSKTHNNPFLFATGAPYFKMPYVYNDSIRKTLDGVVGVKILEQGIKTFVFYKPSNENKKGNGIKLMETGNGSLKKIPTDVQENATCVIFNAYMDLFDPERRKSLEVDASKIYDEKTIKGLVEELTQGHNIDGTWVNSFVYQIKTITGYLKDLKLSDEEISNYRLARYGAQSEEKEPVSTAYSRMVKKYSSILGGRKDAYDPTDILLFNKSYKNEIVACCQEIYGKLNNTDPNKASEIKVEFLDKIFKENICMGISLKKLSGLGKIELFNIDGNEGIIKDVTRFKVLPSKRGNYVQVHCEGTFQFSEGFTDEDGDPLNNTKKIMLTLRTFGANIIGMDVNLLKGTNTTGPAIGKCPVNIWKRVIRVENDQEKNIQIYIDKFNEFLKTDKDVLAGLKEIIQGAVKEGPSCFPFILLH